MVKRKRQRLQVRLGQNAKKHPDTEVLRVQLAEISGWKQARRFLVNQPADFFLWDGKRWKSRSLDQVESKLFNLHKGARRRHLHSWSGTKIEEVEKVEQHAPEEEEKIASPPQAQRPKSARRTVAAVRPAPLNKAVNVEAELADGITLCETISAELRESTDLNNLPKIEVITGVLNQLQMLKGVKFAADHQEVVKRGQGICTLERRLKVDAATDLDSGFREAEVHLAAYVARLVQMVEEIRVDM